MINDRLISGAVAGMVASIAKTIPNYIFYTLGVTKHTYPNLIAMILLKSPKPNSISSLIIGFIIDAVIGGIVGIITFYSLEKVGRRYLKLKGIIFGNLVWLIGPVILLPLFHTGFLISFHYVSLFDHWIFGLTTVYLIKRLYPANN